MPNYQLIVQYDGTPFKGWQMQGELPTVQKHLEDALAVCWKRRVVVHGSGRTDTGVHALGQVASFEAEEKLVVDKIAPALNYHLPAEIRILKCKKVSAQFHARFSATGKEYHYRIYNHHVMSPFELNRAWHIPRTLDVGAMKTASRCLLGEQDFASFTSNPGYARKSTVRHMQNVVVESRGKVVTLKFRANGFLYRMVRNLVGALVKVGQGRLSVQEFEAILKSKNRSSAPNTALACGLYLAKVFYGKTKTTEVLVEDEVC